MFHQVILSHKYMSGYACTHVYIRRFDFLMQFRPTASDREYEEGSGDDTSSQPVDGFLANAMTQCSIDTTESKPVLERDLLFRINHVL